MRDRIVSAAHSPHGRAVAAVLFSFIGVPTLISALGTLLLGGSILFGLLLLVFAVVTLSTAFVFTMSVVIEAERASNTDTNTRSAAPFERQRTESLSNDPLVMLQMRYVHGELTDQEFEQQLDRLLETESESDPLMERTD